jgi:hypothetical protein
MAEAKPSIQQATPWPKIDDFEAQIMAMLDDRDYSLIPEGYYGWLVWSQYASEII